MTPQSKQHLFVEIERAKKKDAHYEKMLHSKEYNETTMLKILNLEKQIIILMESMKDD